MDKHTTFVRLLFILAISLLFSPVHPAIAADDRPTAPEPAPTTAPPSDNESSNAQGDVLDNATIFNNLLDPPPWSSLEADVMDGGRPQEAPGRGVRQEITGTSVGGTLVSTGVICNDFNRPADWHVRSAASPIEWYAGWAPFAVDQGLYRSAPVHFAREQVTGDGQSAIKVSSNQPYAAGLGSPLITAPPGSTVTVRVKYLIWDHDQRGRDYDWASLGVKPDGGGPVAEYVNGYRRGLWSELTHSVVAGPSGQIMVLLQASSPAALNSNVYFDDVQISIDGRDLADCRYQ